MKRISTVSKPRVLEAYINQGVFLTLLEAVLNVAWGELNEKGGKPQS